MPKLKDPNVWFQNALKVTEDPAASGWLKNALVDAVNRDPVDAAGDAEVLYRILKLRAAAVQKAELSGAKGKSPKTTASTRIESSQPPRP
jgi:hypothetical protein